MLRPPGWTPLPFFSKFQHGVCAPGTGHIWWPSLPSPDHGEQDSAWVGAPVGRGTEAGREHWWKGTDTLFCVLGLQGLTVGGHNRGRCAMGWLWKGSQRRPVPQGSQMTLTKAVPAQLTSSPPPLAVNPGLSWVTLGAETCSVARSCLLPSLGTVTD